MNDIIFVEAGTISYVCVIICLCPISQFVLTVPEVLTLIELHWMLEVQCQAILKYWIQSN